MVVLIKSAFYIVFHSVFFKKYLINFVWCFACECLNVV